MPDIPRYPTEGRDHPDDLTSEGSPGGSRAKPVILWVVGILLVVVFLVLHLTGVLGPSEH